MKHKEDYIRAAMRALDFDGSMRVYVTEAASQNEEQITEKEIDKICIEAIELYHYMDITMLSVSEEANNG